jgi:hypothetical protein
MFIDVPALPGRPCQPRSANGAQVACGGPQWRLRDYAAQSPPAIASAALRMLASVFRAGGCGVSICSKVARECRRRDKRFVVLLNDGMGEPQAVEVLCHEWAHALAWNFAIDRLINAPDTDPVEFERACHDEAWGCAYSRVWRAYLDVIREAV